MADDTRLPLGTQDGDVYRSDDIGGVKTQLVKLELGADGVSDGMVSSANPLPVTAAALPLPSGAATEATLAGIKTGTDKIPASPAQEHTAAASPHAARLTDGAAFYKATTPADTQPVSAASLPLPTGAATAALQTQPGVDIGDVTVNNAAGASAVNVQDGGNSLTVDGTVALGAGSAVVGKVSVVDGAGDSAMDDANNALRVNIVAGGAAGGTSATDEAVYTPTSSSGTPIMGAADEAAPDAAAEGTLAIIRATLNRALHVNLRDASGNELSPGGGTQYTEDAAAAADPVGGALIMVRDDVLSGQTTADGDNVAARGTDKGELYVKHVDAIPVTDNAGSLTIDGTVTANLAAGTNNIGDVDVLTVPAPLSTAGGGTEATALRVTLANDSTGLVSVDDNGGSLTVDGTVAVTQATASNLNAEVQGDAASDAPVSGNPVLQGGRASAAAPTDVSADGDAVSAWHLRNGAAATVVTAAGALIGGDATNGLDVDVTRLPALAAGTNNIGDVDVLTVPAPLNVTGNGAAATALRVTMANDSTGIVAATVSQATASSLNAEVQGDAASDAPVSGNPVLQGGRASAAAPTDVSADGDAVSAWHLRNGAAATVITAAGALVGGDATNGLDVDVTRVPAPLSTSGNGTAASALRVTVASDSTGVIAATCSQATAANLNAEVQGDVAHDSPVGGNPVLVGVEARNALPTAVANGDVVRAQADLDGRLVTAPHGPRELQDENNITLTSTTETTLLSAVASIFLDLTLLVLSNTSATLVRVDIRDSTAGTIRLSIALAANGGGAVIAFPAPKKQGTVNNNWTAQLSGAVTDVRIFAQAVRRH